MEEGMNRIVVFRLNEQQEQMLKAVSRKFKTKNLSETIEVALKKCLQGGESYNRKLQSSRGILKTVLNWYVI